MPVDVQLSTGLPGLDRVFKGLIPGDNLVWEVDRVEDIAPFVPPYCQHALSRGCRVIYFRFADHPPLVPEQLPVEVRRLDSALGFEHMITEIHQVLSEVPSGSYFVFDCLSALAEEWCSDRMLGNFFRLTCPYVLDRECMAYFPLLRDCHSMHAVGPISETTQVFIDVYRHKGGLYIHPTKVEHRYSPTMYMLHHWHGDEFIPVLDSSTTAEILTALPWGGADSARLRQGIRNRDFLRAEALWEAVQMGRRPPDDALLSLRGLLRMVVSRDPRVLALAERYFSLGDLLDIGKRMIGTGLVGGKAVGMLLARAILKKVNPRWNETLEAHDSFYIGSDVFYSFLVENGCWWLRQRQRDPRTFLDGLEEARRRILMGVFPAYIEKEFSEMLAYFGQSPIIVRSSSLLEDNYGNAFAGKYESVFCANQGPHQKRLADFIAAVRTIYASTMSEKALRYRAQRGLLEQDEQMSLLVQRVSGAHYGHLYLPQLAGVGYSHNPYVWSKTIDPQAGMLRLVFGLGTRAVDRVDDDYTRVVALNAPSRRPEGDFDEVRHYSQRKVDVIDLEANQLVSYDFADVAPMCPKLPFDLFASQDHGGAQGYQATPGNRRVLTFDHLLTRTSFVGDMREMLRALEEAYGCPVDIEFTANFFDREECKINLVQCRPLQVVVETALSETEQAGEILPDDLVLESHGAVIGHSRALAIDRVVYVPPPTYGSSTLADRYAVARLIGRLLHLENGGAANNVLLIGPGRWGTRSPELGVPVSFSEIDSVRVLCEIVAMRDDLVPDVSLGTHFFNDLVEMDILYCALFPGRRQNDWNHAFLETLPNRLTELVPSAAALAPLVRVIDFPGPGVDHAGLRLHADTLEQTVVCYLQRGGG